MDLSKGHIRALQEGDLTSPKGIEACINASEALLQCMNVALRPGTFKNDALLISWCFFLKKKKKSNQIEVPLFSVCRPW